MSEHNWVTSDSPEALLQMASSVASERKLRLFICAYGRAVWPMLAHYPAVREAVEVAERFADGLASPEQLIRAADRVDALRGEGPPWAGPRMTREEEDRFLSLTCGAKACGPATVFSVETFLQWVCWWPRGMPWRRLSGLFREVFTNPYREAPLPADVLAWQSGTVAALARAAYDERRMPEGTLDPAALLVLADALEDAGGGADAAYAEHLREPGQHHYRGCWVIDRLLGKS
jgi:hypothetical protein